MGEGADHGESSPEPARFVEWAAAYVPMDRRHAMAQGVELPTRAQGTAMFADIAGFTPLTEALDQELGPRRSSEALTEHLNRVYGALIEQVHRFRGSVIGFSGDAIMCWFPGDRGPRAMTCGLGLHAAMRGLLGITTPSGTTHRLSIKVAVTAGWARRLRVGLAQVQVIDVLAGSMIDRLARAEQLAQRGQLVVDAEVYAALAPETVVARWLSDEVAQIVALPALASPDPWPPLDPAVLTPQHLRPWLLPPVWERLRGQQSHFLAGLRPAVALFVRFSGLDFESDDTVGDKLDAYIQWTQQVVQRYEGSLVQLTTGDKGSYLYAAFGALVAHEDDVERSLAAAAALREPPPALASWLSVQLGMSRGLVRAGAYGSETRRTYGALGDETNVAARLMSKAEAGQILVSPRVANVAGPGHVLRPLGEVSLKGKRAPLPVFAYEGRRKAAAQPGEVAGSVEPIIGRAPERATLHAAVDRLHAEREPAVIIVEGEAGIGKSSLLRDLVQYARGKADPSLLVFVAAADALESATAYYAWRPVFAQLFGVTPHDDSGAVRARVQQRLPRALGSLAPLLSAVIDVDAEGSDDPRLRGSLRAASLPRYLAAVFEALTGPAGSPVVLVVEDGHWLDSSSWALLTLVTRAHPSLLAVVTTRPEQIPPPAYQTLRRHPRSRHMALEAMEPADVLALVSRRLGVARVSEPIAALILDKAEGNPFFGEELAHALREAGLVGDQSPDQSPGQSPGQRPDEAARLLTFDFPDTIEALVTGRIDRLNPSEQFALKVASVIGRGFALRTLRDLLPIESERERLPGVLDRIRAVDLVLDDAPPPTPSYIFKHAITRDVAYNLMLYEQRRALHRAAAEWYERTYADDLAPYYSLLAYHRLKAIEAVTEPEPDQVREAVIALARASKHALESSATPEAQEQASAGLSLLEGIPGGPECDRLELALRSVRGPALVLTRGPTDEAVQAEFDRTMQLCHAQGETAQLFEAVFGIWYFNFIRADRQGTLTFAQRLEEVARRAKIPAMRSRAQEARGCTFITEGRYQEGLACMDEAIALAEGAAATEGVAQSRDPVVIAHSYRSWARCFLGYPDSAVQDVDRAIALAESVAHPLGMAQAVSFGAQVYRYRREPDEAEALARRGLAMCIEHGFLMWNAGNRAALGWVALERGDYEGAVQQIEPALRMATELEFGIIAMVARVDLIAAFCAQRRVDEARAMIDAAKAVQRDSLAGFCEPQVQQLEAELWRVQGDDARAEACLQKALDTATATQMRWLQLRIARSLAGLWRDHGRVDEARAVLAPIVDWFEEGRDTPDRVEAIALLRALGPVGVEQ
ncbi:MAG: AAA family ATPase [Myxococcota bacterium]